MQAITTRYHAPTDKLDSRVSAKTASGVRMIMDWNSTLNCEENHRAAARAMCHDLAWSTTFVSAGLSRDGDMVHVLTDHTVLPKLDDLTSNFRADELASIDTETDGDYVPSIQFYGATQGCTEQMNVTYEEVEAIRAILVR